MTAVGIDGDLAPVTVQLGDDAFLPYLGFQLVTEGDEGTTLPKPCYKKSPPSVRGHSKKDVP